jgi:hypothetical protein
METIARGDLVRTATTLGLAMRGGDYADAEEAWDVAWQAITSGGGCAARPDYDAARAAFEVAYGTPLPVEGPASGPLEPCGYCCGKGRVPGPKCDREGRFRAEWPDTVLCEYCRGAGRIEEGHKLAPHRESRRV